MNSPKFLVILTILDIKIYYIYISYIIMSVLGGPYNGYSPAQTLTNFKHGEQALTRRVLRRSWNTQQANGTVNGRKRIITPYRAVNNLGDFLSRQNYVCGGANQVHADKPGWKGRIGSIISQCDGTGVAAGSGNMRHVPDSSNYTRFKKEIAINKTYNDSKNGGDDSNGSYVALMAVRRR
jgi:hypothetical protein